MVRRVAESLAEFVYRDTKGVVGIRRTVTAPDGPLQFFAADHLAGAIQQDTQDTEGLTLTADSTGALPKLLIP